MYNYVFLELEYYFWKNHGHEKGIFKDFDFSKTYHLQGSNFAKNFLYVNSKTQTSSKQLSKSIKYTQKTQYKNYKDTRNRPKSAAEVQNKRTILIKM